MGRVLVELEKSNSTTELTKACLELVFSQCAVEARFRFLNEICEEDLNWCDSYLAVRPFSPMSLSLAEAVKKAGRFYAVMYDDDLINREEALAWRVKCAKECIQYADIVLSPNPILAEEYSHFTLGKRFAVFNTPVDDSEIIPPHCTDEKINLVYAAGRDHAEFFEKLIKPILNDFLSKYAEKVHFTFIGVEPDLSGLHFRESFTFVPLLTLDAYNRFMRDNRFDVGLAPLDDTHFTNRKYFNKFIEYSKVGITGLFSNCLPFTLIVKDKENGILVDNDPQKWLDALKLTINDRVLIEKCIGEAQSDLRLNFSVENLVNVIKNMIPEFESYKCKKEDTATWKSASLKDYCYIATDKIHKFIVHLNNKGFSSTVKLLKNYINDRR